MILERFGMFFLPYQRFIINIDFVERVPVVGMGDRVHVRGMYEWNELGGLVHWTHHDPQGVRWLGEVSIEEV